VKITLIIPDERIRKIGFSKKWLVSITKHHAQNIEKVGYFDNQKTVQMPSAHL